MNCPCRDKWHTCGSTRELRSSHQTETKVIRANRQNIAVVKNGSSMRKKEMYFVSEDLRTAKFTLKFLYEIRKTKEKDRKYQVTQLKLSRGLVPLVKSVDLLLKSEEFKLARDAFQLLAYADRD